MAGWLKNNAYNEDIKCDEFFSEVKAEIRDDFQVIPKSHNGQFELFLLTAEGSTNSDGTDPMKKVFIILLLCC